MRTTKHDLRHSAFAVSLAVAVTVAAATTPSLARASNQDPAPGWDSLTENAEVTPPSTAQTTPSAPAAASVGDATLAPLVGGQVTLHATDGPVSGQLLALDPGAATLVLEDGSLAVIPRGQITSAMGRSDRRPVHDGRGLLIAGSVLAGLGLAATFTGAFLIRSNTRYCRSDIARENFDEYYTRADCIESNPITASYTLAPGLSYLVGGAALAAFGGVRVAKARKAAAVAAEFGLGPTRLARGWGGRLSIRF